MVVNYDSMKNPKYFEEPEAFKPERWLDKKNFPAYAFTPFAAGTRNCLGQHMSTLETKVILVAFMKDLKAF